MYEQQIWESVFFMFYGGVAVFSMIACCYLLFRQGNAIASGVKSPVRLRRWTAAFFASVTLSHVWYLPMYIHPLSDAAKLSYLLGGLLDFMIVFPLAIVVVIVMLQDRRRSLWPVGVMVVPLVVMGVVCVVTRSVVTLPYVYAYFVLMCVGIILYMVRSLRQYDRWLHDNYADLEHKEVWQSLVILVITLLAMVIYTFEIGGQAYEYVVQTIDVLVICYFLWRVETLSDLSIPAQDAEEDLPSLSIRNNIEPLLERYCEEPRLYLQYDLSLSELARKIGTNRVYLSKHFASQGINYNVYINRLRVKYFIKLCQETAATHQPVITKQLAYQSGFRIYGTFNSAFKQVMGMTATEWMRKFQYR